MSTGSRLPATFPAAALSRRLLPLLVAALFAAAARPAPAAAQATAANGQKHMLWEISSEAGTAGYLVGSVHYMKPGAYPLAEVYDEAFRSADVLAFEINLDSLQAKAQSLFQRLGTYPGQKTLEGQLADSTYATLRTRVSDLGVPAASLSRMEPWAAALVVAALEIQRAGYRPQSGIDRHFFDRAKKAGKALASLETPAEQMKYFDGLPAETQAAFLRQSLRQAERIVQQFDEMVAAWRAGDARRTTELVQGEMREQFPDLYRTLIVDRNRKWLPQIVRLLESEGRPMIVVGVGHVTGPHGLVGMLRSEGYTVEQQ